MYFFSSFILCFLLCKALRKKQTGEFIVQFRNFFLIFVIVRSINIFSGFLIVSNKALICIYKKKIKEKIKYNEIENIKYYPILPSHLSISVLYITLKNGTKKIISDFENSKNTYLTINTLIKELKS